MRDLLHVASVRRRRNFWALAAPLQAKLSTSKRRQEDGGKMGGAASKKNSKNLIVSFDFVLWIECCVRYLFNSGEIFVSFSCVLLI